MSGINKFNLPKIFILKLEWKLICYLKHFTLFIQKTILPTTVRILFMLCFFVLKIKFSYTTVKRIKKSYN